MSTITGVAACLALPVGNWIRGRDLGCTLAAGLAITCVAGVTEAASPFPAILYGARIVEGAGYLLIVITGPLILATRCGPFRDRALALWSTFIPVGLAIASIAGIAGNALGWRIATVLTVVPGAAALVTTLAWLRGPGEITPGQPRRRHGRAPMVWLALAFCLIALAGVAILAFLPELAATRKVGHTASTTTTVVVSLSSVPGGALAALLMSRAGRSGSLAGSAIVMSFAGSLVFSSMPWWAISLGGSILMAANGLALAVMYAAMPALARTQGDLRWGYSLLVQTGSLGTLLGPPLLGFAVAHEGWTAGTVLVATVAMAGLALFLLAAQVRGRLRWR